MDMSSSGKLCPICDAPLELIRADGEYKYHHVRCTGCGIRGGSWFSVDIAWASFEREHGRPKCRPMSVSEIRDAGGPGPGTMNRRLTSGMYPDAYRVGRRWMLPWETADRVVDEWKRVSSGELISLPEAAVACGLKRRSLNPRTGDIGAVRVAGRWYVTRTQLRALKVYYSGITTTEAAKRLGLCHRVVVLHRIKQGKIDAVRFGSEWRVLGICGARPRARVMNDGFEGGCDEVER